MDFAGRIQRVREAMEKGRLDALLVTHLPNIQYLTGFTGSAAALLIDSRSAHFYTDGRYTEQAWQEVSTAKIEIAKGSALLAAAKRASKSRRRRLGFESEQMTVATRQRLAGVGRGNIRLKPVA
jgi:Xaa-Pro aminopeptidase